MSNSKKTALICLIVLVGFFCAIAFHYNNSAYRGERYPRSTFLFKPWDVGGDFDNIYKRFKARTHYDYGVYPPFAYVPLYLLWPVPDALALPLFNLVFALALLVWIFRNVNFLPPLEKANAVFTLSFLSYPFLFALDRGNLENWLFVILVVFFLLFLKERYRAAAVFLGFAIAMKVYPGAFVALLLSRRRFKESALAIGVAIAVTGLALLALPVSTTVFFAALAKNFAAYKVEYLFQDNGMRFSASYFTFLKYLVNPWLPAPRAAELLLFPYFLVCLAGYALIAAYVIFVEKTLWKQVALLTLAIILFPQASHDYKLMHLYFPLVLYAREEKATPRTLAYAILFGLILIPKAYLWPMENDSAIEHFGINVGVLINPLLMTALGLLIVEEGFAARRVTRPARS